jgi:hypothetical protein
MRALMIATAACLSVTLAQPAFAVTAEQVKSCETKLRDKNKADNDAAPAGYKVKREKGFRQQFLADCLNGSQRQASARTPALDDDHGAGE